MAPDHGRVMVMDEAHGDNWSLYQADCVDFCRQLPDSCIGFTIYSPPFSQLYIYSDSACDMGNCSTDHEFIEHYSYLASQLFRVTMPGRLVAVHCKQLVNYKNRDGAAGLRDFRGDLIRVHQQAGFTYHAEVTIWKDPVIEMQRTKAHGLLYKQLRADSTFSRTGLAEYLVLFRKWAEDGEQVAPVGHKAVDFPLEQWQQWASPVWMDIRQTNVLNVEAARDSLDDKHICPLQLDLIERAVTLWSNLGDTVLSPFAGIGSEGVVALKLKRRFIGVELKESYFRQAARYLSERERETAYGDLFAHKFA